MTRTTTDLRRAIDGLTGINITGGTMTGPAWAVHRKAVLRLLPEGDEPVYLVTASRLTMVLRGTNLVPFADCEETARLLLSRLGGEE